MAMKTSKILIRWFVDFDKEEAWLNEQSTKVLTALLKQKATVLTETLKSSFAGCLRELTVPVLS